MIKEVKILLFLVLPVLVLQGCVEGLNDAPDKLSPILEVYSPKTGDTLTSLKQSVIYYSADNQNIIFYELYINNKFVKRYDQGQNGTIPEIYLELDPSLINTRIEYYIKAYDAQNSTKSIIMSNILVAGETSPAEGFNTLQMAVLTPASVSLSWKDLPDENYYVLMRRAGVLGQYDSISSLSANTIRVNDYNLNPELDYYYKIKAVRNNGTIESNEIKKNGNGGLASPSAVKAEAIGKSKVQLSWTDNSTAELGFQIERRPSGSSNYTGIAVADPNTTRYLDNNGLTGSTSYTYRIKALGSKEDSPWSAEVTVTTLSIDLLPPSNLNATYDGAQKKLTLTWTDNSMYEIETRVERKTGTDGNFSEVGKSGTDITSFEDSGIQPGNIYYYRVRGYTREGLFSPYSDEKMIAIPN